MVYIIGQIKIIDCFSKFYGICLALRTYEIGKPIEKQKETESGETHWSKIHVFKEIEEPFRWNIEGISDDIRNKLIKPGGIERHESKSVSDELCIGWVND